MTSKLTLTVEKAVIDKAKVFAKKSGRSLSEMIQNYLEELTKNQSEQEISSKLKNIVGSVKLPENFNEDEELNEYFKNKHR